MLDSGRFLLRQPFEAFVAFAGVVSCLTFVIDPGPIEQSAIGHVARVLLPYWEAMYGCGGALILWGLARLSIRSEVAGLIIFSTAVFINTVSVVHFAGTQGIATAATFAALAGASVARIVFLLQGWRNSQRSP